MESRSGLHRSSGERCGNRGRTKPSKVGGPYRLCVRGRTIRGHRGFDRSGQTGSTAATLKSFHREIDHVVQGSSRGCCSVRVLGHLQQVAPSQVRQVWRHVRGHSGHPSGFGLAVLLPGSGQRLGGFPASLREHHGTIKREPVASRVDRPGCHAQLPQRMGHGVACRRRQGRSHHHGSRWGSGSLEGFGSGQRCSRPSHRMGGGAFGVVQGSGRLLTGG